MQEINVISLLEELGKGHSTKLSDHIARKYDITAMAESLADISRDVDFYGFNDFVLETVGRWECYDEYLENCTEACRLQIVNNLTATIKGLEQELTYRTEDIYEPTPEDLDLNEDIAELLDDLKSLITSN